MSFKKKEGNDDISAFTILLFLYYLVRLILVIQHYDAVKILKRLKDGGFEH